MKEKHRKRLLLGHLIFLSTFPAVATDMYLPALPIMVGQLHASVTMVNLTLMLFFLFFGASMLFWGTLSDKYGRRPTLLVGTGLFVIAGFLCAISYNIYQLIAFRIFQAIGSGAAVSISMAVIKDVFEGKERAKALSFAATLMAIAPIVAPLLGSMVLNIMSWRGIFVVLGGFGVIAFMGCLVMKESIAHLEDKNIIQTLANLLGTLKNPGFTRPLIVFSFMTTPILAYLSSASNIYIIGFKLSEQVFSIFFAVNAFFSAFGPMIYLMVSKRFGSKSIITFTYFMIMVSGLILILWGNKNPFLFALGVFPASLAIFMARPPGINLLLEKAGEAAGAGSSLINFFGLLCGSLGMVLISLDWSNRIHVFGLLNAITGLICLILWPLLWKK